MFPTVHNHVHAVIRTSLCLLLVQFLGRKKKNKTKVNIIGSQKGLLLSKLICSDAIFSFICNMHLPTPLAGN